MNANRYEITDHERGIRIAESNGIVSEIGDTDGGEYLDDAVIGAIRQLQQDLAAVTAERDEWIACHAKLFRKLGNLLAVIHRDGGHYQSEHGIDKAIEDAQRRICDTHAGLGAVDELAMLVRRLAHALKNAAPDSDLPKIAMDYLSIAGLSGSPMRRDE